MGLLFTAVWSIVKLLSFCHAQVPMQPRFLKYQVYLRNFYWKFRRFSAYTEQLGFDFSDEVERALEKVVMDVTGIQCSVNVFYEPVCGFC